MRKQVAAVVLASFIMLTIIPAAPAGTTGISGRYIYLKAGKTIPQKNADGGILSRVKGFFLEDKDEKKLFVIQLTGPVKNEWKTELLNKGVTLGDYIPDFAFLAQMTPEVKKQISSLDFISSVTPFKSEYKLDSNLGKIKGQTRIKIAMFGSDKADIEQKLKSLNGKILSKQNRVLVASVLNDKIKDLANNENIIYMEPVSNFKFFNDKAGGVISTPALWNNALQGQGQVIGVADTGIDTGKNDSSIHKDLQGRIKTIITSNGASAADKEGHGTHIAGSIVGNGTMSNGQVKGIAPQAQLVFQGVSDSKGGVYIPSDLGELFKQAYDAGARIHSDSWGTGANNYDFSAQSVDRFMWNNNDMTILFAAGNDGDSNQDGKTDYDTISSPATAKNVITVGATENNRPDQGYLSNEVNKVAFFSSRGNTSDGRIKPDIVTPGTNILSTKSSLAAGSGPYNNAYWYMSGTSMATPITAGAAALVRQYYIDKLGVIPKPSLLKATLINGVQDMGYGYPSKDQGWGRTNLGSLYPASPGTFEYDNESTALSTGGSKTYTYSVTSSSVPLKVTTVWTDYPGSTAVSKALVNDLDLVVTGPDGTVYNGNDFTAPFNDSVDRVNNVENVIIKSPKTGTYKITVKGYNIPTGPQKYSHVVTGAVSKNVPAPSPVPTPSPSPTVQTVTMTQTAYLSSASSPKYKLYYIDVTSPGQVKLNLQWWNNTDLDLYLFDPDWTQVARSAAKGNPETITFNATKTGRYCIKVNAYSGGAAYILSMTVPTLAGKTGILSATNHVDTGATPYVFYDIPTKFTGSINTEVNFNNSNQTDVDIYLYDQNWNLVTKAASGYYRDPETFSYPVDKPGTYHLKIKAYRGGTNVTMQTVYPK